MPISDRISKLREQSLRARPAIDMERARLITRFFSEIRSADCSVPVSRSKAFSYLLENKEICINEGELIVGERGPKPKATPTYPEVCTHTEDDLRILGNRDKISWDIDERDIEYHIENIIPFWSGRSIRDRIFSEMDDDWLEAYKAGVFTEFQEQRAPGHTVLDDKIYRKGLRDFKDDIDRSIDTIYSSKDDSARRKIEELRAMKIAADGLIKYAKRHSAVLRVMAENEEDEERKRELSRMAAICGEVPERAPKDFWEALQYYWFVHLGVITEFNTWDSFNPGRLDQHLYPFYRKGLAEGTLTEESARELLQSFWIKFNNQPAPPKVGVTAKESNTYTDFCLINLGGLKNDGSDGVNDLTFLILDVIEEMRILQPSSMVQLSEKNPDEYIKRAIEIIRTGFGQPSVFNTEAIVKELVRQGKALEDAICGGASGCVETGAFGKESYILTGYFNLPKVLELTLNNGVDPLTGKMIGLETGEASGIKDFKDLIGRYERQLRYFIDIKIEGNRTIERLWAEHLPAPFLSILIDDCIENGTDYNDGGARYNTSYIQGVGLGTIVDSLSAIKYNVFENGVASISALCEALKNDFEGNEEIRQILLKDSPRYGNDDERADDLVPIVFDSFFHAVDGKPNTKGGVHRINLLPTTCHIYFGEMTGATPDGRKGGEPLSEGISPVQGMDVNGPTAVLKSAARIDHIRTGGTLLNQKFTPQVLSSEAGIRKLVHLIRAYFKMDGHHIQFNVVSADTLREAQINPEKHRNLIVRVAGYSDYFVDLGVSLQNEIIRRTEHTLN